MKQSFPIPQGMKLLLLPVAITCSLIGYAQIKTTAVKFKSTASLQKVAAARSITGYSFLFKGKPAKNVSAASGTNAARVTTRDGITKTVQPYDGSTLGATESAGPVNTNTQSNVICQTQSVTLTAGFNELNLLDPNAIEIWPGRLINISSMDDGTYTSFTGFNSRNNIDVALLAVGSAQSSVIRTIPAASITQGNVVNAVNSMKNSFGNNDFGSESWMFDSYNFFSSNQFLLEAGAGVNATPINLEIRASAGFSTREKKNKIVLRFLRRAFDVKVDSDLGNIINTDNISDDAGIIAGVSYGQFGIVEIESDSSLTDMNAALDFAFNVDPTVNVSGNLRTQLTATIASFSIKGIFKGVQGNSNIISIPSINDLKNMLLGNGDISATTPVVPVAFVVKSLKDGATMMLRSTMSYQKRECTVVPAAGETKLRIKFLALTAPKVVDWDDNEEIFGTIRIKTNLPGLNEYEDVWTKSRTVFVKVFESTSGPQDPKATSLTGAADIYEFTLANDKISSSKIFVNVKLKDDEFTPVLYDEKTIEIPVIDLLNSLKSTASGIDNFNSAAKAFFVEVTEQNATAKIRVWFKAEKIE